MSGNPNHKMYKSGGVTVVEDLDDNELRVYEDNDGYLHVRLDSDMAKFILGRLKHIDNIVAATGIDKPIFGKPEEPCICHTPNTCMKHTEEPNAPADGVRP